MNGSRAILSPDEEDVASRMSVPYDDAFFDDQVDGSLSSARAVIPLLLKLLPVRSVVDFGCGRGTWLKVCLENGVETALGLDGDYVRRDKLLIDPGLFRSVDLRRPIELERRFDLALCLEVGEHLPSRSGPLLVESLAKAAPVVVFSAALPGQGGTDHINEQWPAYWQQLFERQGMRKYDVLRPLIWNRPEIEAWYRQNLYIFTKEAFASLDSMDQFEPMFVLAWESVMKQATFQWSSKALRFMPLLRRFHGFISRALG
jgi:hypothetical protein